MSVRPATIADLPVLLELAGEMHRESPVYRSWQFDRGKVDATLRLVMNGAGVLLVSEVDGVVRGGIAGIASEHWFSTDLVATDLALFVARQYRNGTTALRLVAGLVAWAKTVGCKRVSLGITTGVHPASTARLYIAAGLVQSGTVFSKDF